MLAQISSSKSFLTHLALLVGAAVLFSSCASKPEPQIIAGQPGRESALPWNQQQKWESQGQFGPLAERLQSGR
ncbi:MAG: hypothetical protein ACR2HH_03265 [Chthoniobacterales bacterium]